MPVYRLVGDKWQKSQNIFLALDPAKPFSTLIPKFAPKLTLTSMEGCRFFACDGDVAAREIDPEKSMNDQKTPIPEKASIFVASNGEVPSTVTETLGGSSPTPAPASTTSATSAAASTGPSEEEINKKKKEEEEEAAAALLLKQKLEQQEKEKKEREAKEKKENEEKEKKEREQQEQQHQQQQADVEAQRKKHQEQKEKSEREQAEKEKQQKLQQQHNQQEEQEQQEREREKRRKEQEALDRKQADEAASVTIAAAKKRSEDAEFKKQLDAKEAANRRREQEEKQRLAVKEQAAAARKSMEEAASARYKAEDAQRKLPAEKLRAIHRLGYTHRAVDFDMLFLQEELERTKILNSSNRELFNAVTATTLLAKTWTTAEKTPLIESMRLYTKTLLQKIALLQLPIEFRKERDMQFLVADEDWAREQFEDLRKLYDDVCEEVVVLRSGASRASYEVHQANVRRTNAEQSEFIALEKLRMEEHQLQFTTMKLEEAENRLKDVESRNTQLIATVEKLGQNLLQHKRSRGFGGDELAATAQTSPGATSVVHCVDEVPDHVLSTSMQLERRWNEKDEKLREVQSALTSTQYKLKEAQSRLRDAETQREAAVSNNAEMQASLKNALALAKTWEGRATEFERKMKTALTDTTKAKDLATKTGQDLRRAEAKIDAAEAALLGMTLERDRAIENTERQKGEIIVAKSDVEKKHALVVNLEMRETSLRNQIQPMERRVRELTGALENASALTQKLQKELEKRDQALQKLRNHIASVTGQPSLLRPAAGALAGTPNNSISATSAASAAASAAGGGGEQGHEGEEGQQEKPIYRNKPLGYLGLSPSSFSSSSRRNTPSRHQVPVASHPDRIRISELGDLTTVSPPGSGPFRRSPALSHRAASGAEVSPVCNRSTRRKIQDFKFEIAREQVDALVNAHLNMGDRSMRAAAGSQIASTLEKLQMALTDTEIELNKEVAARISAEDKLVNARRAVDEMTKINLEMREQHQQSIEDAINFFAGAGGESLRSAVNEVFAFKEMMLENETLKMRFREQSKRVTQLEVRCQVLERHLESLARGGRLGVENLPGADRVESQNLSFRSTAADHAAHDAQVSAKASSIKKKVTLASSSAAAAAGGDEEDDFNEEPYKEDPQLLELIRAARKEKNDDLDEHSPLRNQPEAVLRVSPRASTPPLSASKSSRINAAAANPSLYSSPYAPVSSSSSSHHHHTSGAARSLQSAFSSSGVVASSHQQQQTQMIREQNAELEAKLKKLDEWRLSILDVEEIGNQRAESGNFGGVTGARNAAHRLAHTPPRSITPIKQQHHTHGHHHHSGGSSARPHRSPGTFSKASRDLQFN